MTAIDALAGDLGLEIVATQSYKADDADVTAQLTAIKGADPEVLIVWGTSQGAALAAKNMQQLGMEIPTSEVTGSRTPSSSSWLGMPPRSGFPGGQTAYTSSITDPDQKAVTDSLISMYQEAWAKRPTRMRVCVRGSHSSCGCDRAGGQHGS